MPEVEVELPKTKLDELNKLGTAGRAVEHLREGLRLMSMSYEASRYRFEKALDAVKRLEDALGYGGPLDFLE